MVMMMWMMRDGERTRSKLHINRNTGSLRVPSSFCYYNVTFVGVIPVPKQADARILLEVAFY